MSPSDPLLNSTNHLQKRIAVSEPALAGTGVCCPRHQSYGINRCEGDMYFSIVTGRPAIVHMSPIGILARMTHGHLLEIHKSTAAAFVGKFVDATPFLSKSQREREVDARRYQAASQPSPTYRTDQYGNRIDSQGYRIDANGNRLPPQQG